MCSSLPIAPRLKLQEGQRQWWDPAGGSTNQQRCESLKRLTSHTKNNRPHCGDVAENQRAVSWVMHIPSDISLWRVKCPWCSHSFQGDLLQGDRNRRAVLLNTSDCSHPSTQNSVPSGSRDLRAVTSLAASHELNHSRGGKEKTQDKEKNHVPAQRLQKWNDGTNSGRWGLLPGLHKRL